MIKYYICNSENIVPQIEILLKDIFEIDEYSIAEAINKFKVNVNQLDADLYFVIEHPYVDKVYRDSYYNYYSSKLKKYNRDCIRVSLFKGIIDINDFRNCLDDQKLKISKQYLGFLILRPTAPNILGRSVISPEAIIKKNITICKVQIPSTVFGMKFFASGFPHSSQDRESITCAQTTIWSLMEYFGFKYPEYTPVFPFKITKLLTDITTERQLPSKGLYIQQISYVLRNFGFGSLVYSRSQYGTFFENLLSCYVESGIPLIIALEAPPDLGHATLCIGHGKINDDLIDNAFEITARNTEVSSKYGRDLLSKNIKIYDFDDIEKEFVFNDDNLPVYHTANLRTPTNHKLYNNIGNWPQCTITHFIVPLYPKIYLEAYQVKNYILKFLLSRPCPLENNLEIVLKVFLSSSRSYKNYIALESTLNDKLKALILELETPKFIWIAELSTKDLIKKEKINGLIILDATEPNIFITKPFIIGAYQNKLIMYDNNSKVLKAYEFLLEDFNCFKNNLKENGEEY